MSWDLRVWTVREPRTPGALPSARGWQIVAGEPAPVEAEDVPEEVATALPGIAHLLEISVEPIGAPESARDRALKIAKEIAREAHGVVEDPQSGATILPTGVKRFVAPAKEETISIVELAWWIAGDRLASAEGVEGFLAALEAHLPDAMPRRYGPYEPPKHVYAETGREHLAAFLRDEEFVVWYPHRPVRGVHYGARSRSDRRGYKAAHVEITIEAAALDQPGWRTAIRRAWRELSRKLRPFYGDARILRGYLSGRATLAHGPDTEQHPVFGPWWAGIPATGAFAAVVGEPYLASWPALAKGVAPEDGLAFLESESWAPDADVFRAIGGVPATIAQRRPAKIGFVSSPPSPDEYPAVYPFTRPEKTR